MKHETRIKFVKTRVEDGDSLYDLIIDGEVVERDLDMQQVVQHINARDEDIGVRHTRTPEDGLRPMKRRSPRCE